MATLKTKIKLYLEANSKNYEDERDNIFMQDDGSGPYIKTWSVSGLDKPNDSQLTSYETAGNTLETNNNVRLTRKLAYGNIGNQLDEISFKFNSGNIDSGTFKLYGIKDS